MNSAITAHFGDEMNPWSDLETILQREIAAHGDALVSNVPEQFGGGRHIRVEYDLLAAIAALPEMNMRQSMRIMIGFTSFGFGPHLVAQALILRSLQSGCQSALEQLKGFLESEETVCNEIVLLGGIAVNDRIDLGHGLYICAPEAIPIGEFQKKHEEAKAAGSLMFSARLALTEHKVVGSGLIREGYKQPKFSPGTNADPALFESALPKPPIHIVATLLALVGPSSPIVYRHFFDLDDFEFLKGVDPQGFISSIEETRVSNHVLVSPEKFDGFSEIVSHFEKLPTNTKDRLSVPLHRLNEAIRHRSSVDKALDLGIALESLLLSGAPDTQQLALQFRLRGAWLLGRSGDERKALVKQFNRLYSLRSAAAHDGKFSSKHKDVDATLAEGQSLCAAAIKTIILRGGYPDWDALLVGANYIVEEPADEATNDVPVLGK